MLSSKIKYLRDKMGYTQQQVADFLNIERSTYAYYESGKTKPDLKTIMKLSEIFNVPCTEFLENDNSVKFSDSSLAFSKNKPKFLQLNTSLKNERETEDMIVNEQKLITYFRMFPKNIQEEIIDALFNIYKKIIDIK